MATALKSPKRTKMALDRHPADVDSACLAPLPIAHSRRKAKPALIWIGKNRKDRFRHAGVQ
jgi:hypothetical protein